MLKQQGFFEYEQLRMQGEWERARWSSFWVLKSQTGKKWPYKPTDIITFDWEKPQGEEVDWILTKEEMDYLSRKMGQFEDKDGRAYNA